MYFAPVFLCAWTVFIIITNIDGGYNILKQNIGIKFIFSLKILKFKFVVANMLHWSVMVINHVIKHFDIDL